MALSVILLVLLSTWHFQAIPLWQDWFWNKINKYCAIVLFIFWKNCFQCVFLRSNRFPTTWKNGIQTSSFDFRFLTTYSSEIGILFFFVFRFPTTLKTKLELLFSFFHYFVQQNCNCHFCFSSSVFVWHWKRNFNELRFSFPVFLFYYVISLSVCMHFSLSTRFATSRLWKCESEPNLTEPGFEKVYLPAYDLQNGLHS